MNILAIDPSVTKPVAIVSNLPLYDGQAVTGDGMYVGAIKETDFLVRRLFRIMSANSKGVLVIESPPYMPHQNQGNLHQRIGMMKSPFICGGWQIVDVNPRTWQKGVLGHGGMKSDQVKQMSKEKASELTGEPIASDDLADAICIFHWYRKQEQR